MAPSSSNGIEDPNDNPRLLAKPKNALSCNTDQIAYVELYRPKTIINNNHTTSSTSSSNDGGKTNKKKKRRAPLKKYHLLFAILYLYQVYWIYSTIGLPYKEFLDKAEREGFEGKFL